MPVAMTSAAVSVGMPPARSARLMAIGAVTDFGASDAWIARGAPIAAAIATALTIAVSEPQNRAASIGTSAVRTFGRLR